MTSLSVVIATYQRPAFLTLCLHGLALQERIPDELLLVVRSEDQQTQILLKSLLPTLPCLQNQTRIIFVDEPGIVAAENQGLQHATSNVVVLLDDDAIPQSGWLQRIEAHYEDPQVGAVGGPTIPYVNGKPLLEVTRKHCLKKHGTDVILETPKKFLIP